MSRIHTIDLHYLGLPEAIASYIIETDDGPVMIESGPGSCVPHLISGLDRLGYRPGDVRHLLVSHIHLDHAGAAGWMAQHGATVHVHEFGARHLIDPSKLLASAKRIYQDRMDELWGELIPVPASQVVAVHDGDSLEFGGVSVHAIESPGHARHHHAFAVEADGARLCFTGDAAACFVHECPAFISLPTPPPEFDYEAWLETIDRLQRESFDAIYPTHFGRVDNVDLHLDRVRTALCDHYALINRMSRQSLSREAMLETYDAWFTASAREAGVPEPKMRFYVKGSLVDMNLTGMLRYRSQINASA